MDNTQRHHRKSIRLRAFDYSQEGLYFITICSYKKECLFGEIENGEMILNATGEIAYKNWLKIPEHFPNAVLHEYIVMPNHMHGIIELTNGGNENDTAQGANSYSPLHMRDHIKPEFKSPSKTIGSIVRSYKGSVTNWLRENMTDYYSFDRKVWQRNFHDHIIRN